MRTSNLHRIVGIDPKNLVDEYKDRALGELSDAEIFDQVCQIVAGPRVQGLATSLDSLLAHGIKRMNCGKSAICLLRGSEFVVGRGQYKPYRCIGKRFTRE